MIHSESLCLVFSLNDLSCGTLSLPPPGRGQVLPCPALLSRHLRCRVSRHCRRRLPHPCRRAARRPHHQARGRQLLRTMTSLCDPSPASGPSGHYARGCRAEHLIINAALTAAGVGHGGSGAVREPGAHVLPVRTSGGVWRRRHTAYLLPHRLILPAPCLCIHFCLTAPINPCRGAHGAIIVYDITCPKSFLRAKFWVGELQRSGTDSLGECGWWLGGWGSCPDSLGEGVRDEG